MAREEIDRLLKKLSEDLEATFPEPPKEDIHAAKIWYKIPIAMQLGDKIEIEFLEGRYQLTKIYRNEKVIWKKLNSTKD